MAIKLLCACRSAQEAEDLIRQALEKGEILPKEERFDSNCITPGKKILHGILLHHDKWKKQGDR